MDRLIHHSTAALHNAAYRSGSFHSK